MQLEIGKLSFRTKGEATAHFRAILYKYDVGAPIKEPDATELRWLFERHPEYHTKSGSGVSGFSTRDALYGKKCFEIIRHDGTKTDFSAKICIDAKEPTAIAQAMKAMRAEVSDQIIQKKWQALRAAESSGGYKCPLTGKEISAEDSSVHYQEPGTFRTIAFDFLRQQSITPDDTFISPSKDNQYEPEMRDRELAVEWRAFHDKRAVIIPIAKWRSA